MGHVHAPQKAILFAGILSGPKVDTGGLKSSLAERFAPIILESESFVFDETDYYRDEMGSPINRFYLAFDRLIDMDRIAEIKLETNRLEGEMSSAGGRRTVNIDPGYLTSAKVVLATTKDYGHRVYMGGGIYAEVTLRYRRESGGFQPWEWTFRDYRREEALGFFNELRRLYRDRRTIS